MKKKPNLEDCLDKENGLPALALDLINRQKAEIEALTEKLNATIAGQETLQKALAEKDEKNKILQERNVILRGAVDTQKAENKRLAGYLADAISHEPKNEAEIKTEAIKEYTEKLKGKAYLADGVTGFQKMVVDVRDIDETYDKMVGDAE